MSGTFRFDIGRHHSRLEVSDNVGDLGSGSLVNEAGEGVLEGRDDKDIGEGDSLSDEESLGEQDLVEGVESLEEEVVDALEGGLGVSESASEDTVGDRVLDENLQCQLSLNTTYWAAHLLVGEVLPLVDLGSLLGVGGGDGLVGAKGGDCGIVSPCFALGTRRQRNGTS
jgi:hypothetical protein